MNIIGLVYIFFSQYLVPLLFVIGLMNLIYGVILYYVQDNSYGDGREYILRSILWFAAGLAIFMVTAFFGWFSATFKNIKVSSPAPTGGVEVDSAPGVLKVPNVPTR